MKIIFSSDTKHLEGILYYDVQGNIILKMSDIYYFLDIDKNNELEFIEIENMDNLDFVNKNTKYKPIKNTYEKYSLREKAMDEIEKEEGREEHFFDEEDNHDEEYKEKYKYYPEDKYYYVVDEDYNEDESDNGSEDECIYSKYKHDDDNDDIISCFDKTLGTSSLYDTLIFDKTNKLILKTIESKNTNSYRITINTSGEFELNVVGDKRISFVPIFINKDDKIIPHFKKLHIVPV